MFAIPGSVPFAHQLTRDAAKQVARSWWMLLLNGTVLIVAGVLIFSIDWTIRPLPRRPAPETRQSPSPRSTP